MKNKSKNLTKITRLTWQQFENIRASGITNMLDQSTVFLTAMKHGYKNLVAVIQEKRYIEIISGYSKALKDKKFHRKISKEDLK